MMWRQVAVQNVRVGQTMRDPYHNDYKEHHVDSVFKCPTQSDKVHVNHGCWERGYPVEVR